tara:strand:- start:61 stop:1566 length:1506 start_codon:yes stop_codon:yes gene_type:complete
MSNLIVILPDQLSINISSLKMAQKSDLILLVEPYDFFTYVEHHKKKLIFQISSIRNFYNDLKKKWPKIDLVKIDKKLSLIEILDTYNKKTKYTNIIITEASEYYLQDIITKNIKKFNISILPDDRFFCSKKEFISWSEGKKQYTQETFYRYIRKKHKILMNGDKPEGDLWNFDKKNRKNIPKDLKVPKIKEIKITPLIQDIIKTVENIFPKNLGDSKSFNFATTSKEAKVLLNDFLEKRVYLFGDYQDAMKINDCWLFHSCISMYLNNGLLEPKYVINQVVKYYKQNDVPINSIEGFIRQIIGWREFIRGIYWKFMPEYKNKNFFKFTNKLPSYFWNGKTDMRCLKESISDTINFSYANHIQRLMVLGNFLLLSNINPIEVQNWYLIVYADAYEWVEMPNVVGMSLYADGGVFATKPYISSGNYINKMSDYCRGCKYNVKTKLDDDSCPFNYLYWNFLIQNSSILSKNPRLSFAYMGLNKISESDKKTIIKQSKKFLGSNN